LVNDVPGWTQPPRYTGANTYTPSSVPA